MKKIYCLLLLIVPIAAMAQFEVNTVSVATNDLVYDSMTDRIYVSIPSANGANGNSIGVINPNTYMLENTVFIGSEPTALAISDDGQFIYSGFDGSATVRKFDVATQTSGLQFIVGSDPFSGSFYVEDIEVMPGQPNTIAISRRNPAFTPRHEGVAIYDNGVQRPVSTQDHTGSNRIEFTSQNTLVGYNNESTERGVRKMSTNASGVTVTSVNRNLSSGLGQDFSYHNNRMYATNGAVVDITNSVFVLGTFANVNGPSVYDTSTDYVCYASYNFTGDIVFQRFNPNTFLLQDNLPITAASGNVTSIVTCGNGCYAFNSSDNKVVIVKDTTLGNREINNKTQISVYPNPSTDYISISNAHDIEKTMIYNLSGQLVGQFYQDTENLFVGDLPSGTYLIILVTRNDGRVHRKLIKN